MERQTKKSIIEQRIDAIKYAPPRLQLETLNKMVNARLIQAIPWKDGEVHVLIATATGKKLKVVRIGVKGYCGEEVEQ